MCPAGLPIPVFSGSAAVCEQLPGAAAPPAGGGLHLHAAAGPISIHLLLSRPPQPLSLCHGKGQGRSVS